MRPTNNMIRRLSFEKCILFRREARHDLLRAYYSAEMIALPLQVPCGHWGEPSTDVVIAARLSTYARAAEGEADATSQLHYDAVSVLREAGATCGLARGQGCDLLRLQDVAA